MAVFTKTFVQDLKGCMDVHITEGLVFSADNDSNVVSVEIYNGGEAATLTGSVVVYVIRADGNTVVFGGTLSGNTASAVLPQSCFVIPGPIAVMLQIVSGDVRTTVLKAVFTAVASSTGAIIDPGHVIPDISDIIAMLDQMEAATEAACQFLKSLKNSLGSWTAAAAAYNCGAGGLTKNMEKQSISNYYNTRLNNETSRYVYRILAMKQIMQHPQEYGFYLRPCDLYPTLPTRTATLSGQNVDIYAFAKANGCSYKVFRELNPWITTEKLTNKANRSYTVKLPVEGGLSLKKIRTDRDKGTSYITKM